jgi:hypothetical protein
MAECRFVDPIADIAVLGSPDGQVLYKEAEEYETLTEAATPLAISDPPKKSSAWLLSLAGRWFHCTVGHNGGMLWIADAVEDIVGGMSGSPIVADDGTAIGVECSSLGAPNPRLTHNLPGWLLRELESA